MRDRKLFSSVLAGVFAATLIAPATAYSDDGFSLDYIDLQYSRMDSDDGESMGGVSGRINLAFTDQTWIAVIRDDLSTEDFDEDGRFGFEYNAVLLGAGDYLTDTGMWYVEAGPTISRITGGQVRRSLAFAFGIRTQISPRFELGGGPRFGIINRTAPENDETMMRIHGALSLSERVSVTGSFDYREDGTQWRLGARVGW